MNEETMLEIIKNLVEQNHELYNHLIKSEIDVKNVKEPKIKSNDVNPIIMQMIMNENKDMGGGSSPFAIAHMMSMMKDGGEIDPFLLTMLSNNYHKSIWEMITNESKTDDSLNRVKKLFVIVQNSLTDEEVVRIKNASTFSKLHSVLSNVMAGEDFTFTPNIDDQLVKHELFYILTCVFANIMSIDNLDRKQLFEVIGKSINEKDLSLRNALRNLIKNQISGIADELGYIPYSTEDKDITITFMESSIETEESFYTYTFELKCKTCDIPVQFEDINDLKVTRYPFKGSEFNPDVEKYHVCPNCKSYLKGNGVNGIMKKHVMALMKQKGLELAAGHKRLKFRYINEVLHFDQPSSEELECQEMTIGEFLDTYLFSDIDDEISKKTSVDWADGII